MRIVDIFHEMSEVVFLSEGLLELSEIERLQSYLKTRLRFVGAVYKVFMQLKMKLHKSVFFSIVGLLDLSEIELLFAR